VSACIERADAPAGNVRREPLSLIRAGLKATKEITTCRDCWTLCRGFSQFLGDGGSLSAWRELVFRMKSV
jgi:hypothetical protein